MDTVGSAAQTTVACTGHLSVERQRFEDLVRSLREALGQSSGLTSEDVDVEYLTSLMESYDCCEGGWKRYAMADASQAYTRNLVDEGNGKSNLLVLVWTPGKGSPIHDHGNAHCLMKILRGNLTETRYAFPACNTEQPMQITSQQTLEENAVAYMADDLGTHKMENRGGDVAVSLHRQLTPEPWSLVTTFAAPQD